MSSFDPKRLSPNSSWKLLLIALTLPAVALPGSGCSGSTEPGADDAGDAGTGNDSSSGGDTNSPDGDEGGAGGTPAVPTSLYGIGTLVTADMVSSDYMLTVPDLQLGGAELDLDEAREFAGQSDLAAHEGAVLVASGDEPTITKYTVDAAGNLKQTADVSFSNYGIPSAAFWNNQFVAKDKAYMVNGAAELIIWNPETMAIEGAIALPELEARAGLKVVAGLADRSSVVHDGKYYLPLYWTDDNYAMRSDDSVIVVIDVATDTVEGTIEAPCPGLDYATADDDGVLHFSNWTGGPGVHYVLGTAQNCIATVDPATQEVSTKTFASITGGHEGAAFKYAGDGRFVLSVFDEVRADIENAEDPFTPVAGTNWQLWSYDPATEEATPIEDVDWNSGAIIHARIDDKFYSMVPGADYASTVVYSLDGANADPAFAITGWSFRLFKIR